MTLEVPLFHWRSYRLYILLLLMITLAITTINTMHIGVTLTCMVNASNYETTAVVNHDQCPNVVGRPEELGYTGDLEWTTMQQSQLFAVFFWANLMTMGFSGAISDSFGAKLLIVLAIGGYAFLSFISPMSARLDFYAFLATRFLMGATEGFVFPSMATIVCHWIPPNERTTAAAIYTSGHQLASLSGAIISSHLCSFHLFGGWPLIFYFFGILCVVNAIVFMCLLSNRPEENRWISEEEKIYLHDQLMGEGLKKKNPSLFNETKSSGALSIRENTNKLKEVKLPVPLKRILLSPAVHAISASEFSYGCSTLILAFYLPSFFRDVMAFDMNRNGYYTALPFLIQIITKLIVSTTSDRLKARYGFSATVSCKVIQTVSTMGTAIILVCMGFLDCTKSGLAFVLIALFGMFFAGEVAGAFTATLFVAPPFAGTISSITATIGATSGIIVPTLIGFINKHGTPEEWSNVFFLGAAVNLIAGLMFLIFGSAEIQPWAMPPKQEVYSIEDGSNRRK